MVAQTLLAGSINTLFDLIPLRITRFFPRPFEPAGEIGKAVDINTPVKTSYQKALTNSSPAKLLDPQMSAIGQTHV